MQVTFTAVPKVPKVKIQKKVKTKRPKLHDVIVGLNIPRGVRVSDYTYNNRVNPPFHS